MNSGSPERFAMSKPQPPAGSTDRTYILRIYVAAPGTPVQPPGADSAQRSAAGHVYFSVSDGSEERGYGFSPIESGTRGPGHVVRDEHRAYQEPAYIRTMEISKAQYDSLQMYERRPSTMTSGTSAFNTTGRPTAASTSPGAR